MQLFREPLGGRAQEARPPTRGQHQHQHHKACCDVTGGGHSTINSALINKVSRRYY